MNETNLSVCIAGMHRSGTSMVASLLQKCGLYLGPQEELGFDVTNGEPHWENVRLVALNEKILNRLGGSWDNPPKFPAGWECKPEVESLAVPAMKLIAMLGRDNPLWGWKDPRNSLTIPFWQRLIPELTVVICVRNPFETSRSLQARGDSIASGAFNLWLTYYRELLAAVPPEQRVVTHYESYFDDPVAELLRVANAVKLEVHQNIINDACASVSVSLRHHSAQPEELAGMSIPAEVRNLYLDLCHESARVIHP
jgi:hypothetical protein